MLFVKYATQFANTVSMFIPEVWTREVLPLLTENFVAMALVNQDFSPDLASMGQTVHTRRPKDFKAYRKSKTDAVTVQDTDATGIDVKMDQHIHTSFKVHDLDRAISINDFVRLYAAPAAIALARAADRTILGQYSQFVNAGNMAGKNLGLTTSTVKDAIINTRRVLDNNKCPEDGRNLILSPYTEADMLRPEWFTSADKVGDMGTALRTASLGEKLGFQFFKSLNMTYVPPGNTTVTGAINNASGHAAGATSITVDGFSAAIGTNSWISVNGYPYRVASTTGGSTPTAIALQYGLKEAVADNDVVTVYTPAQVNLTAGYAVGWDKEIVIDTTTVGLSVGQMVSFGTTSGSAVYTIVDVSGGGLTGITLDRALEAALSDNDKVNMGPAGAFNLAFTKNAITAVNRGLPPAEAGARSAISNFNGLNLRSTITYNGDYQYHLVTLDMLFGVKVLDTNQGAVLLG